MNNKILVLGATGNIGSWLVKDLQKKNANFVAGVPASQTEQVKKMNAQAVALDFSDAASLDRAMKGIDSLFMLLPAEESMVNWGRNIIQAAQRNKVSFILRSSLIDARPGSSYFLYDIHGRIDQMLRDSGIPCCIVHPNSFMQNYAVYYAQSINQEDSFSFLPSHEGVSYVDCRDIAAVDAEILANPSAHQGKEYTVTGPGDLYYDDIATILSNIAGRTIRFIPVDEPQYVESLRAMGMSDWDIKATMSFQYHINDGKQAVVTQDVRTITGKSPLPFDQFARDYAQVWKKVPVAV